MLFVRPALLALQGDPTPEPDFRPGVLAGAARQRPERDDFVRARLTFGAEGALVEPIGGQESHMIARTAAANAIVHIPRGSETLDAGARVRYLAL
jgi:molybdopterin molybdotransferase